MPVSDAADTWLSLASELSPPDLVAVGDHLILEPRVLDPRDIRPYVTIDELHDRLAHFSGRGAQAAASALRLMRHGAESRPETLLRLLLGRAGFPEPLLQAEIVDDGGHFHGFADLYYPEFKVIVEYDGDHHRTRVSQYDRDITRIDEFIASGNAVVRVRAARIFRSPSSIAPLVLRAHERQAKVMGLELPLAALRSQLKG